MTEINPYEEALRNRAKAKRTIACAETKLEGIQKAIAALQEMEMAEAVSERETVRFRSRQQGTRLVSVNEWPPDFSEVLRLVQSLETARKDLDKAERKLADLGTPI